MGFRVLDTLNSETSKDWIFSRLDFYCSLRFKYGADYLNHGPLEPKASVLPMSNADPPGVVIWDPGPIL